MKREDFEQALDRYGGDLGRWPEAIRVGAERLIEDDHDAADELARAQKLDGLLTEAVAAQDIESSLVGRPGSKLSAKRLLQRIRPNCRPGRRTAGTC